MANPLRLPDGWLKSRKPKTLTNTPDRRAGFGHSVMSYTRMDVPTAELHEIAVTFDDAHADPLAAHEVLTRVFGKKAGKAFLFRADSASPGRYWVYSAEPWAEPPSEAVSALAPKRIVVQLAEGLSYHFTLEACVGEERVVDGQKDIEPFDTEAQIDAWFRAFAPALGVKPVFFNTAVRDLRVPYDGRAIRIRHAVVEGVLEVADADRLADALLHGVGSHKRLGLGLLRLSST